MSIQRTMGDKKIAGVCGGLARELGMSSATVRWIFVLLVWLAGMSGWVYLIAWMLIPSDGSSDTYKPD
ncbi:MAG: PspC domain-containing protein [Spirochaetia bacterium]|nr:PspC domain-containing protein [Spirochaetia bacterium]